MEEIDQVTSKKKQLRREREFRKIIIDSYANDGVKISNKEAKKIFDEYKLKSREQRIKIRMDYLKGASEYRGYDLIKDEGPGIILHDIRDVQTQPHFEPEKMPPEVKYNRLKKDLLKIAKEDKQFEEKIKKVLKKYER